MLTINRLANRPYFHRVGFVSSPHLSPFPNPLPTSHPKHPNHPVHSNQPTKSPLTYSTLTYIALCKKLDFHHHLISHHHLIFHCHSQIHCPFKIYHHQAVIDTNLQYPEGRFGIVEIKKKKDKEG